MSVMGVERIYVSDGGSREYMSVMGVERISRAINMNEIKRHVSECKFKLFKATRIWRGRFISRIRVCRLLSH